MTRSALCRAGVALGFVAAGVAGWLLFHRDGALEHWLDVETLRAAVRGLGAWGPVAVIALMATAILVSPLPSAPIALAAGALYGHGWGTLYVLVGSELGAIAAFSLARYLGYEFVHRYMGERLSRGLAGSQRVLMTTVFVSRLLPFVSFDLVSYAAGLTVLKFWRFVLATLGGILPASFALAHFGAGMSAGDPVAGGIALAVLGALGVAPLVAHALRGRHG